MSKLSIVFLFITILIQWENRYVYGEKSEEVDEDYQSNVLSNAKRLADGAKLIGRIHNDLAQLEDLLGNELQNLKNHHLGKSKEALGKSFIEISGFDKYQSNELKNKRFTDSNLEEEIVFCSECFINQSQSQDCLYCYNKYLYKPSKRTKPSSKYWYSRAGRR